MNNELFMITISQCRHVFITQFKYRKILKRLTDNGLQLIKNHYKHGKVIMLYLGSERKGKKESLRMYIPL